MSNKYLINFILIKKILNTLLAKYFKDAKKIRSLCIFFPKMTTYKRNFDETECISFLYLFLKDKEFLEK